MEVSIFSMGKLPMNGFLDAFGRKGNQSKDNSTTSHDKPIFYDMARIRVDMSSSGFAMV
jgi:hypothetical protein